MRVKISTPQTIVYQGEIITISLPTENGNISIGEQSIPMVTSIKPGIITITPLDSKEKIHISTEKGMAFVDGKIIRIVSSNATTQSNETKEILESTKKTLEDRIKLLKTKGSIEEIETYLNKLEKIKADISLKTMQIA